jgi:alpha-tubulin suppressor-like RCC1 family protein
MKLVNRRGFLKEACAFFWASSLVSRFARAAGLYNVGAFWRYLPTHLWVWGVNTYGQLGTGNTTSYSRPVQVAGSWTQVCASWTEYTNPGVPEAFSFGVRTDGTLWAWGDNTYGELGLGTSGGGYSSPVQIPGSWIMAAGGSQGWNYPYAFAIRSDSSLWAWGNNSSGNLGQMNTTNYSSPVQIMPGSSWSSISGGFAGWLGIQTNGTLWACGGQAAGELGTGSATASYSSPVQVAGSWSQVMIQCDNSAGGFSCGIKADGSLWAWGGNDEGDCGTGNTTAYSSPVLIGGSWSWTQLSIGAFSHGLAVRADGTLWGWGINSNGQLGTGDTVNRSSPTQIGTGKWRAAYAMADVNSAGGASLAIHSDGTLWGWGGNSNGQLGNGSTTSRSSPVMVATGNWTSLSVTGNTVLALR